MKAQAVDAVNVLASSSLWRAHRLILDRHNLSRLPSVWQWSQGAEDGGLISYGPRLDGVFRQCGRQVVKLKSQEVTVKFKLGHCLAMAFGSSGPKSAPTKFNPTLLKARIEVIALSTPEISFKACGNTQENMHKAENKDIPLIPQAQVVKSGVVRIFELQVARAGLVVCKALTYIRRRLSRRRDRRYVAF